jgi:hypothetical protein
LATTELLPADKPIVGALRLPERLTQVSSCDYTIGDESSLENRPSAESIDNHRLRGMFSSDVGEAVRAAGAGADFLVMRSTLWLNELARLCRVVRVPVFARGIGLEEAWVSGASGLNEIID